ncbi:hypothetical protein [Nostoc sp. ChiSLP03a]|uniref:hypothetical protein n=1 Tax=Nostoc sp. ChiSLP03a TaxID=3075380 RepID=UPI00391AA083
MWFKYIKTAVKQINLGRAMSDHKPLCIYARLQECLAIADVLHSQFQRTSAVSAV